ncbi:MAG: methyltransferase domain-containing protein [Gemmatimonadota bacterium]|nr:methyltransferase domain-containing protein [Gemmatimonadota bacterium]
MRTHLARLVFALAFVSPAPAFGQTRTAAPPGTVTPTGAAAQVRREDWQRVPDIFAALGAKPGSRIADLGAGEGWLSVRLARHVGASGRVFAVDISDGALGTLAEKLAKDSLRNVELVLAEEDDPRLPFGTLDGVVILNAYHEMPKRVPILDGVKRALRPGGVLVIVDNAPVDSLVKMSRKEQTSHHALALDYARDDLEAQGFEIVSTDPKFVDRKMADHWQQQWLIVARRSAK